MIHTMREVSQNKWEVGLWMPRSTFANVSTNRPRDTDWTWHSIASGLRQHDATLLVNTLNGGQVPEV